MAVIIRICFIFIMFGMADTKQRRKETIFKGENVTICLDEIRIRRTESLSINFAGFTSKQHVTNVMIFNPANNISNESFSVSQNYSGRIERMEVKNNNICFRLLNVSFLDSGNYSVSTLEGECLHVGTQILVARQTILGHNGGSIDATFMCNKTDISLITIEMITTSDVKQIVTTYVVSLANCTDFGEQYTIQIDSCVLRGITLSVAIRGLTWLSMGTYFAWDDTNILLDSIFLKIEDHKPVSLESSRGYVSSPSSANGSTISFKIGVENVSGTGEYVKYVCQGDYVQAFQNIDFDRCNARVSLIVTGEENVRIANWLIKDCIQNATVAKRYEGRVFLNSNRTITLQNVRVYDEGKYVVESLSTKDQLPFIQEVQIQLMVGPSVRCKPIFEYERNTLVASLDYNDCGIPPATVYWLKYGNQIMEQTGNEEGPYHACIQGPALRCLNPFKATDFCSSFKRFTYKVQQPNISIESSRTRDNSITLQCNSKVESSEKFYWSLNDILITNNAKYSLDNKYLIIRNITNDEQYNIYSCLPSGERFVSDPYSILASGPSIIHVIPSKTEVKELDTLNVSCLSKCDPLCSVTWSIPDSLSGFKNISLKNDVLQITNVTRMMSGNYTCKVQNLITGAYNESSLLLNILYGPEKVVLNISESNIELDKFDSISILCTAECFPSCVIYWAKENVIYQKGSSELTLVNVSSNGTYTCHASNPRLETNKLSKIINITVNIDEEVRPIISLQKSNTDDRTITLQCLSNGNLRGIIRWRRNGILVTNNAKYSHSDEFLVVRYPNLNDIHDKYTCFWSDARLESVAYSLETSGPSFIEVLPSITVVKESDNLNVSCLHDCYPLCSVTWTKTDPFSGYVNTLLKKDVLKITNITRKMSGNYICKVQNLITLASAESSVSLDIQYGPEEIVLNTSSNVIKLAEFDSITIRCTAECFPSCFFTWTKQSVNKQIGYAELSLINVSSNGTYTCYAWNPSHDGPTLQQTINILIEYDTIRQKISPTEHSPDTNSNMYDYPTIRYLMYALPVIGGLGLISTIVYCLRKKYTSRSRVTQVSMNPMNERPREGESNQDQTSHYWTIDPNAINSLRTSVQSDVDVELRQIFDSTTKTTLSQTCEGQASSNSGYIEVVSTFSDSFQLDGYINPINYDITQVNGTTSPRESSSIDCNEYLNPVHSNICEIELDPTDPNYKEASGSVDSHILSHSGDHDRDSVSACSNALECDDDLDQLPKTQEEIDLDINQTRHDACYYGKRYDIQ